MKIYLAYCRHDFDSDNAPEAYETKQSAINAVTKHFHSYDFKIVDGKPFDPDHDDGKNGGFDVFSNVKMVGNKIASFYHFDGEGPVGFIDSTNLKK